MKKEAVVISLKYSPGRIKIGKNNTNKKGLLPTIEFNEY